MKLQRQISRKSKKKEYVKWVLVVPPDAVDKLGWKEGTELTEEVKEDSLKIRPLTKDELKSEHSFFQPTYQCLP